jgi:RNA polymerase sigma-70 factor (ECF subfamily)
MNNIICKDILKSAQRSRTTSLPETAPETMPDHEPVPGSDDALASDATLQAVLALPAIYKDVVYLHYYEGYKTDEIARMLGGARPSRAVKTHAEELLKLAR